MPDPLLTQRHRGGNAARPAWGVPTGGQYKFWEANAFRARKDAREDRRQLVRWSMRHDNRGGHYTGAPTVIDKDVKSNVSVFNAFTGTLRTEYAQRLEQTGAAPGFVRVASTTHLGIGYERAEAEEETLPAYRTQQGKVFGALAGPAEAVAQIEVEQALAAEAQREAVYGSGDGGGGEDEAEEPYRYSVPTGYRNAERRAMKVEMSEKAKALEVLKEQAELAEALAVAKGAGSPPPSPSLQPPTPPPVPEREASREPQPRTRMAIAGYGRDPTITPYAASPTAYATHYYRHHRPTSDGLSAFGPGSAAATQAALMGAAAHTQQGTRRKSGGGGGGGSGGGGASRPSSASRCAPVTDSFSVSSSRLGRSLSEAQLHAAQLAAGGHAGPDAVDDGKRLSGAAAQEAEEEKERMNALVQARVRRTGEGPLRALVRAKAAAAAAAATKGKGNGKGASPPAARKAGDTAAPHDSSGQAAGVTASAGSNDGGAACSGGGVGAGACLSFGGGTPGATTAAAEPLLREREPLREPAEMTLAANPQEAKMIRTLLLEQASLRCEAAEAKAEVKALRGEVAALEQLLLDARQTIELLGGAQAESHSGASSAQQQPPWR